MKKLTQEETTAFIGVGCIMLVIALVYICASITFIRTSNVGIKTRFGVMSKELLTEGTHFINPFTQKIRKVSLRQRQHAGTVKHTQTMDMQPVSLVFKVMYSVPVDRVLENEKTLKGEVFEVMIMPRTREVIMDVIAVYPAENLISNRLKITAEIKERLAKRVKETVKIEDISIGDFSFENERFYSAVQEKVVAKQIAERAHIELKTTEYEAKKTIIEAQAKADQIRMLGRAEADKVSMLERSIKENSKAVQLKAIEKWNGKLPDTLLQTQGKDGIPSMILNQAKQ